MSRRKKIKGLKGKREERNVSFGHSVEKSEGRRDEFDGQLTWIMTIACFICWYVRAASRKSKCQSNSEEWNLNWNMAYLTVILNVGNVAEHLIPITSHLEISQFGSIWKCPIKRVVSFTFIGKICERGSKKMWERPPSPPQRLTFKDPPPSCSVEMSLSDRIARVATKEDAKRIERVAREKSEWLERESIASRRRAYIFARDCFVRSWGLVLYWSRDCDFKWNLKKAK